MLSKPPARTRPPASSLAMSVMNPSPGTAVGIEESSSMIPLAPASGTATKRQDMTTSKQNASIRNETHSMPGPPPPRRVVHPGAYRVGDSYDEYTGEPVDDDDTRQDLEVPGELVDSFQKEEEIRRQINADVQSKLAAIPPPPGVPDGGVWGSIKCAGPETAAISLAVDCLCLGFGECAFCCPVDEVDAYAVNQKVCDPTGKYLGPLKDTAFIPFAMKTMRQSAEVRSETRSTPVTRPTQLEAYAGAHGPNDEDIESVDDGDERHPCFSTESNLEVSAEPVDPAQEENETQQRIACAVQDKLAPIPPPPGVPDGGSWGTISIVVPGPG